MKRGKPGIYPPPVYEAHLSDGTVERLSYHSPQGKPIDFEAGRRAADEILLIEPVARLDETPGTWERTGPNGTWRCRWPRKAWLSIIKGYVEHPTFGEDCEAVELYPAEDRLVDTSNKYHLYACTDPAYRFPFGFPERDVSEVSGEKPGHRQRRFG